MRHTWIQHGESLRLPRAAALKVHAPRTHFPIRSRSRLGVTAAKKSGRSELEDSQVPDPDKESPAVSASDRAVAQTAMAPKKKNVPVGIEWSAENAAIGLVYFTQGVLGLARLATTYFFKDVSSPPFQRFSALPKSLLLLQTTVLLPSASIEQRQWSSYFTLLGLGFTQLGVVIGACNDASQTGVVNMDIDY